jgi:hypothetical protein
LLCKTFLGLRVLGHTLAMFEKISKILASFAIVFFLPLPAEAAMSCDRVGAKSQLHYGSQVSGSSVRICGEYWLKYVPKPIPKPEPKPVGPPKVYPKSFLAMPSLPSIYHDGPERLASGQEVTFSHTAVAHSRQNWLMGYRTEVRFRPVKVAWYFGGAAPMIGNSAKRGFFTTGLHNVRAKVTYSVKFRFLGGTKWIREPRTITMTTQPLSVRVSAGSAPASGRVILVLRDCKANSRAIGC